MTNRTLISNRYLIIKHIGKGGMADVYVAVDTVLKREVAIKILKSDLSSDEIALERFHREANAATKLSHPNIVDIYDVGDDGNYHYIVMEYIRGKTLKELIRDRGPIEYNETITIMKQLCSAIMEAHRNGIIHRDIKSQNILLKADGTIKVLDFGIALANNTMQITSDDSVLGSVHYLAPEVAKGEVASMQSDIYSIGIVFYELLTGNLPFNGERAVQVVLNSIKKPMPSVRKFDQRIPQSIENIILKATAKNRKNRYNNVAEMLKDLEECLNIKHVNDTRIEFDYDDNLAVKQKPEKQNKNSNKNIKNKLRNVSTALIGTVVAICLIVVMAVFLYMGGFIGSHNKIVTVPDILNQRVLEASDVLDETGLILDLNSIQREMTDDVEAGLIIRVEPEIGTEIERGSTIKVVVSDGIYSKMENFIGKNIDDVKTYLMKYPNIRVIGKAVADEAEPGTIIEQEGLEPDAKFNPDYNQTITFTYSEYISIILPFDLVGMDVNAASSFLDDCGIKYVIEKADVNSLELSEEEIADLVTGQVVKTDPAGGTSYIQTKDAYVTLYYYE